MVAKATVRDGTTLASSLVTSRAWAAGVAAATQSPVPDRPGNWLPVGHVVFCALSAQGAASRTWVAVLPSESAWPPMVTLSSGTAQSQLKNSSVTPALSERTLAQYA